MKEGELKTVAMYSDPIIAHIAEGMLRENGIPAMVFGEVSSYPFLNWSPNQVELKVNAEDYDDAMTLLAASQSAE